MANKSFFEELFGYRVKVERDGKEIVNAPGILCLPAMLVAPKLSIAGMVAAPLLGCKIRVEGEDGNEVDVGNTVRKAAETVADSAGTAARTIKDELEKAWEAMSAEDAEETCEKDGEDSEPVKESDAEENVSNKDIVEELEKAAEAEEIPTIHVNPDDTTQL